MYDFIEHAMYDFIEHETYSNRSQIIKGLKLVQCSFTIVLNLCVIQIKIDITFIRVSAPFIGENYHNIHNIDVN